MALRRPTLLFCIVTIVLGVHFEIRRPSMTDTNRVLQDCQATVLNRALLSTIFDDSLPRKGKHKDNSESPSKEYQEATRSPDNDEDVEKYESDEGKGTMFSLNKSTSIGRKIKENNRYHGMSHGNRSVVVSAETNRQNNTTTITTQTPNHLDDLLKHRKTEFAPGFKVHRRFTSPRRSLLRSYTALATKITKSSLRPPRPAHFHDTTPRLLRSSVVTPQKDHQGHESLHPMSLHTDDASNLVSNDSLCKCKCTDDDASTCIAPTSDFNDSHAALPLARCDKNHEENKVPDMILLKRIMDNDNCSVKVRFEIPTFLHRVCAPRDPDEDAKDLPNTSFQRILENYDMHLKSETTPKLERNFSLVCLCITLMFFRNEELKQKVIALLSGALKDTRIQKIIEEFLKRITEMSRSKGLPFPPKLGKLQANDPADERVFSFPNTCCDFKHIPRLSPKHSEETFKSTSEEGKPGKTDPIRASHWLKDFTHFIPRRQAPYVSWPVSFLPSIESTSKDAMSYLGYRLASLSLLPPSCDISRTRLAQAGFYYDNSKTERNSSNMHEVTCYSCGVSYSQWKKGDNPDTIHQQLAPNCQLLKESLSKIPGTSSNSLSSLSTNGSASVASSSASSGYWSMNERSVDSSRSMSSDHSSPSSLSAHTQSASGPDARRSSQPAAANDVRNQQSSVPRMDSAINRHNTSTDLATDCVGIAPTVVTSATRFTNEATRIWPSRDTVTVSPSNHSSVFESGDLSRARRQGIDDRPPVSMNDAVYPQFSRLQDRRGTFGPWPLSHVFHPDDLVMQGFYYAGYGDCIRCFYCGVGLKSWCETDDVMVEHIRWRPSCGYLLNTKGRQFVDAIIQRIQDSSSDQTAQTNQRGHGSSANPPPPSSATTSLPTTTNTTPSCSAPRDPPSAAKSTNEASARSPRGSSGAADLGNAVDAQTLTAVKDMGFKREVIARAVCQLQQSGVARIEVDALLETLLALDTDGDDQSDEEETAHNTDLQADGSHDDSAVQERAQRLASENERMKERNKCKICKNAKVGMIFLPCGHLAACTQCGSKMRTCSMCGDFIKGTANVYI